MSFPTVNSVSSSDGIHQRSYRILEVGDDGLVLDSDHHPCLRGEAIATNCTPVSTPRERGEQERKMIRKSRGNKTVFSNMIKKKLLAFSKMNISI